MIHQFLVKDTGVNFLYNNLNNTIYDTSMNPIVLDKGTHGHIKESGSLKKSKRPKFLRIAMGKLCNMSCSYCLQEDLAGLKDILDPNVDKFLEDLQKLDLDGLERVELWGGETFAYWPTMKKIFSALDQKGISWYLPTNGTLLATKHIDYLKRLKGSVAIGISHDGPGSKTVRGRDPFPRLGRILYELNWGSKISYSLNATMSHRNHDIVLVRDWFERLKDEYELTRMGMEFDKVESYDLMSYAETIHGDALKAYGESMRAFFESDTDKNNNLYRDMIKFAESIKGCEKTSLQSRCGADWEELISVDINGDVLTCPMVDSSSHKCGTIENLDEVEAVKLDFMREHNGNGDGCRNCPVLVLCNKGCPLELADIFRARSCALLKEHNLQIQLAAFRYLFKSDVELIRD